MWKFLLILVYASCLFMVVGLAHAIGDGLPQARSPLGVAGLIINVVSCLLIKIMLFRDAFVPKSKKGEDVIIITKEDYVNRQDVLIVTKQDCGVC